MSAVSVITAGDVQESINAWDEIVRQWEVCAERQVKSKIVVRTPMTVTPPVVFSPVEGSIFSEKPPVAVAKIPAFWVRGLPTNMATDANVLQFCALATFASLHVHSPLIGRGAELSGESDLLFQVVGCVAAMRAGVAAATGITPVGVPESAVRMVKYDGKNIHLRMASRSPAHHAWAEKVWEMIKVAHSKFPGPILTKISNLGPIAGSAGLAIANPNSMSSIGRMFLSGVTGAISTLLTNSAVVERPWVTDVIAIEVAAVFPRDTLAHCLTDPAMAEALTRCLPMADEMFRASIAREKLIRERHGAGVLSYIGRLAGLMDVAAEEEEETEAGVFTDEEEEIPASAVTPAASRVASARGTEDSD